MVGVAGSNPVFRLASSLCRGGGIGRRTGLKILRLVITVPVRSRSSALFREIAQLGRAPGLGPGGRRFESCFPDLAKALKELENFLSAFLHIN